MVDFAKEAHDLLNEFSRWTMPPGGNGPLSVEALARRMHAAGVAEGLATSAAGAASLIRAAEAVCRVHRLQRSLWEKVDAGDRSDEIVGALVLIAQETGEKIDILRAAIAKAEGK